MARPKLTLYFDIVSPFAYLAVYLVQHSPLFKQCDLNYVPIFLGGIMKATGNTAPINIKNKYEWIGKERERWAKQFNIPIAPKAPKNFPPNTLKIMRALSLLKTRDESKMLALTNELYRLFWVEAQQIQEAGVHEPAILKVLGKEMGEKILEEAGSPEAKKLLQQNTDEAFAEGAFGLPWMVATNARGEKEGFWGFDHFGQVLDHLGIERGQQLKAML